MPHPSIAPATLSMLTVERALRELRAGNIVRLVHPEGGWHMLAAEYASDARLSWFSQEPALLLSPERTAVLGLSSASCRFSTHTGWLEAMIDPLAPPLTPISVEALPVPPVAGAAIALVKRAELLPAVLIAREAVSNTALEAWVSVSCEAIDAYPNALQASYRLVASASIPLHGIGEVMVKSFRPENGGQEHLAILVGKVEGTTVPVRLHSSCLTGDILGSLRCDCQEQLHKALYDAHAAGGGVVLYLNQEGRGIGLVSKLKAYCLQDRGVDSFEANRYLGYGEDERDYRIAAVLLKALGITHIQLMTNNPDKIKVMVDVGIVVEGRLAHRIDPNGVNDAYLRAKKEKRGHF